MSRILKGLLLSVCMLVGTGMMACCSTDSSCCSTDCCSTDCCPTDCCETFCCDGKPYFNMRSQSWNAARELVGWQQFINQFEVGKVYGAFSITPEYTRSFRPCRLAGYLFGKDLKEGKLTISGSRKGTTATGDVTGAVPRESHEWLADYFGLAPNFHSEVRFTPRISNFLVDLNLYVGFDELFEGSYMRIHAPIVWTKWQLNMCEDVKQEGTYGFDMGYMDTPTIVIGDLPVDFASAMKGVIWGDMQEALNYGKIDCCNLTKTRLSDIHLTLGWNFLQDEDYHFGLFVRAGFPTGNKPEGCYLFEPMVGNGGHFELGGGVTLSSRLWLSDDEEKSFYVYLDGQVAHLFNRKQIRSYDLANKPNSRYMLIQELGTPVSNLYGGATYNATTASTSIYQEKLFPLINKSTCCTDVSIAVMGEAALKFAYNWNNWSFDIGYNIWGRSGEKVCKGCTIEADKYALKGDAYVVGWGASNNTVTANGAFPLAATENNADIHAGTNTVIGTAWALGDRLNPRVDNAQLAWSSAAATDGIEYADPGTAAFAAGRQTNTSIQPVFLKTADLDTSKTPSALSHKIFAHISYAWKEDMEEDDWTPFCGLGGEVEFGSKTCNCYSALSQWGIWLKGGVAFH